MMTTAIETVSIGDAEILCVRGPDGRGYVVVRRVCEVLGLDFGTQRRKLENAHWATVVMMTTVAEDGKIRELFCLLIDCVPMWLATINPRKVASEMRPMLERFQVEASGALWRWFNGDQTKALPDPRIEALERVVAGMAESQALVLRTISTLAIEVKTLRDHGDTVSPENCREMRRLFLEVADWMVAAKSAKTRRSGSNALRAQIMQIVGWRGSGCRDDNMPAQYWPIVRCLLNNEKQKAKRAVTIQSDDKQRPLFVVNG